MDGTLDAVTLARLREWIAALRRNPDVSIAVDADLVKEGFLDSLEMVSFILYIEQLRGKEIPEPLIQPENFVSLRAIHDTFFRPEPT